MPVTPLVDLTLDIKPWLNLPALVTDFDSVLNTINLSVSSLIQNYCDTDFQQTTYMNEVLDGVRTDAIVPRHFPILSVISLNIGVGVDGMTGLALTAPNDFEIKPDAIILKRLNTPMGRSNVLLSYVAGYAEIPAEVKQAALLSIEAFYQRRQRGNIGVASRTKQGETESYAKAWDPDVGLPVEAVALLQRFKFFEWPTQPMAARNY